MSILTLFAKYLQNFSTDFHPYIYAIMHDQLRWVTPGLMLKLLLLIHTNVVSAQTVTIRGYVEDDTSGERIIGASIYAPKLNIGATTNQYGFYTLTSEPDSLFFFAVSHVGYESISNRIILTKDTTLSFTLVPRIMRLEDLHVVAARESELDNIQMSRHEIPIEEIETLPVILGEIDIQNASLQIVVDFFRSFAAS